MQNETKYEIIQTQVTNADGETATVYGLKAETEQTAATVYDISCDAEEAKTCMTHFAARRLHPSQLFEAAEEFVSRHTALLS